MLLQANAEQARREIAATGEATAKFGREVEELRRKWRHSGADMAAFDRAAADVGRTLEEFEATVSDASAGLDDIASATGRVGESLDVFDQLTGLDLGPVWEAVTDVADVMSDARDQAGGLSDVLRDLGGDVAGQVARGMLSVINPARLAIGALTAIGSAGILWVMSLRGETRSLETAMGDLSASVDRYIASATRARAPTEALEARFGSVGETVRALDDNIAGLARARALEDMRAAAGALAAQFGAINDEAVLLRRGLGSGSDAGLPVVTRDETLETLISDFGLAEDEARSLLAALQEINDAALPEDIVVAAERFASILMDLFGAADKVPRPLQEAADAAQDLAIINAELVGEDEAIARAKATALATAQEMLATLTREAEIQAAIAAFGRDSAIVENMRREDRRAAHEASLAELGVIEDIAAEMRMWDAANPARNPLGEWVREAAVSAGAYLEIRLAAHRVSTDILTGLREEEDIARAILIHGEGSAEVAGLRLGVERRLYAQQLESQGIVGEQARAVLEAWDHTRGLEGQTRQWAAAMAGVRAEITGILADMMTLGGSVLDTAAKHVEIEALRGGSTLQEAARERRRFVRDQRAQAELMGAGSGIERQIILRAQAAEDELDAERAAAAGRGGRGGRAGRATERERQAVLDLIASLETELDLLRETDPVMQEMIRHRDVLAAATDAERGMVEELIGARIAEADALDLVRDRMDEVRDTGRSAVRGLIQDLRDSANAGDMLANVLDRVADRLLDLGASGLSDVLFGQSGSSNPGLLGGFLSSILFPGVKANAMGDVVGQPTLFQYANGRLGVMGEAGAEAIMPLTHAMGEGVGAMMGGMETTLPLTRLASGKLGVEVPEAFAAGGVFGHVPPPPVRPGRDDHGRSHAAAPAELIGRLQIGLDKGLTAQWEGQMRGIALEATDRRIEQYDHVLPDRMAQISADPHFKG